MSAPPDSHGARSPSLMPDSLGVRVAVPRAVVDLRLVVDLVPHDAVVAIRRRRRSDGEREAATPRLLQQLKDLT